jgi:lipoteichoic acid synthase
MKFIKKIFAHNQIIEFLSMIFIVLTFDMIFILRYGFGVTLGHWFIAFFNVAIIVAALSLIKKNTSRYIAYVLYLLVMFTFFITDSTLYFFKEDVTSIAMLLESGRDTMQIGLRYNPLSAYGILSWAVILIFLFFSFRFMRKVVKKHNENQPRRLVFGLIAILISMLGLLFTPKFVAEESTTVFETPADKSVFVQRFGSVTYHTRDILTFANNKLRPIFFADEYKEDLDGLITDKIADQSPLFGELKDQNVIMIMCETCEEYAFSREHTPNYYRLVDGGIYFPNFYSAAKSNYTYDSEFKSLTSMMYFQADNYMYTFGENTYNNALPHVLSENGYTSNSFHNFSNDFFNRDEIHLNMGFERFYALNELDVEENEYWPLDSIMFDQFRNLIVPIQEDPFFSFVITVTPHGPHSNYREELSEYYNQLENDPTYFGAPIELLTLTAAQMDFDKGLGILLDDLEEKELLDNTTIVLFSDHKNYSSLEITNEYTPNSDIPFEIDKVPFVIYSQKLGNMNQDILTSHYDIAPTIMDLLGISYYQDYYYGQSVFLEDRLDLPIILSYSSWISYENHVRFDEVVSGNDDLEDYFFKKTQIYDVIEKFEKMFIADYFVDLETYLVPSNE